MLLMKLKLTTTHDKPTSTVVIRITRPVTLRLMELTLNLNITAYELSPRYRWHDIPQIYYHRQCGHSAQMLVRLMLANHVISRHPRMKRWVTDDIIKLP